MEVQEDKEISLPDSVKTVCIDDKEIYLIGTAHVSKKSVEDVHQTVKMVNPDTICVELCKSRYNALKNPQMWKKMDIFKVIKEGKAFLLLAQFGMSAFYKKLGEDLEVTPGGEMFAGIDLSEELDKELVLADRDVQVTLKRLWGGLSFWQKMNLASQLLMGLFSSETIESSMVEEMKELDQLENLIETFAKDFPDVKKRLIDERDVYLSQKIKNASGNKIVAVVGAGHIPGIIENIKIDQNIDSLKIIPPPSKVFQSFKWLIPAFIIALFIYGFFKGGVDTSIDSIYIWIMMNGCLSALGALIACGHPLTIFSAFVGAPLTSLNPMIAAGWVSGLVQAWVKKPIVDDFENLPKDLSSFKSFWLNPVIRVLLVVTLSNLGSAAGTFIAGSWIAAKLVTVS